jgi:pimeloyl-ACP methyl ester carboxylesterase
MTSDHLDEFLTGTIASRLLAARDPGNAEMLSRYFGEAAYQDYLRIARKFDNSHLAADHPPNLIFLPGVMGSLLKSQTKGGIWWIDVRTRKNIERLRLSPDGYLDVHPDDRVVPCTTDPTYELFLTAVLNQSGFGHRLYPYDWRKSLALSTSGLRDLILNTFEENGRNSVHLVAHSMGGLVVRATLMDHWKELQTKLGRIVFIATPHYGSPAIAEYLKNHLWWGFDSLAVLGLYLSPDTLRSLRGVLGMLPAPRDIYPGTRPDDRVQWTSPVAEDDYIHPCANFDLYRAESWQLQLTASQVSEFQATLDGAADFYRRMDAAHTALPPGMRDKMLIIAGVGYKTLFRLAFPSHTGLWQRMIKVTDRRPEDAHRDGDGRVPVASASLENVQVRYVKGVHGGLTNIPAVYEEVFRWLKGKDLRLPDSPRQALAGHLAPAEGESEAPSLDGTYKAIPFSDDPGLWNEIPVENGRLQSLDEQLDAGQLPGFSTVHLL